MNDAPSFSPLIRRVILRTSEAVRLAAFYRQLLKLIPEEDPLNSQTVSLHHPNTGDALLTLIEDRNAQPAHPQAAGLFHIAFLFPDLNDWRAVVRRALSLTPRLHGASDHGVSWAVYLEDPDGNGLELAWDKPAAEWSWRGDQIQMVSRALPLRSILLQGEPERESTGVFHIGHLHLQVNDLHDAEAYQKNLGLRVTQSDYPGALFLARGRYHHHLALNTWRTKAKVSRPDNATGLIGWDMHVDHAASPSFWRDPSGSLVTLAPTLVPSGLKLR